MSGDTQATEPDAAQGSSSTVPPPAPTNNNADSGPTDAGKKDSGKDAGKVDSGKDAGPPPPSPGDACAKPNEIFTKSCGKCGTQQAVCLADGDGGAGKVTDYSACTNEIGQCMPGDTADEACGNCGTAKKTCNQYCAWTTGACTGQPQNSCKPGTVEYVAAGCTQPNTYRSRSCQNSCEWTNISTTCEQPVNAIVLSLNGTVNQVATQAFTLSNTKVASRLSLSDCPLSSSLQSGDYPYEYIEVKNPTASKATVTMYLSGAAIDTIMAAYGTPIQPMDDTSRNACKWGVSDQSYGDEALTGSVDLSILKAVEIPAGSSILVYVGTYPAYNSANPTKTTGALNLNVRTDALN